MEFYYTLHLTVIISKLQLTKLSHCVYVCSVLALLYTFPSVSKSHTSSSAVGLSTIRPTVRHWSLPTLVCIARSPLHTVSQTQDFMLDTQTDTGLVQHTVKLSLHLPFIHHQSDSKTAWLYNSVQPFMTITFFLYVLNRTFDISSTFLSPSGTLTGRIA
jgi:hypothetical protein